ncbi:hypothetical protein HBI56_153940 [Parastagonospora nodorum]|uniref:Uncharacterized protein n=1 Tax=Phaeosphaeria nodorum (strain SN15 / ATCC MYA-4574 / FGSC 10173) TaxID=321614 RepID=A0A7U2I7L6_PHANO|nr:hypothetical protein HBH56_116600 [Parastagonospora nodorum]QRD05135.1 hypothetical protein JI435_422070 [Parastagonospora nodorum SN15]KAH3928800.1 hypothetical protein HBH54_132580 [Parastagonospora nodorum]KAH3950414.1 hypothetical protein HBH53_072840 [Parastagonospora nodorum]KAH3965739.1 hypothetical protein HBH51_148900 [Parastagonospora nodorum]
MYLLNSTRLMRAWSWNENTHGKANPDRFDQTFPSTSKLLSCCRGTCTQIVFANS